MPEGYCDGSSRASVHVKSIEAVAIINYFVLHDLDRNLEDSVPALQSW
jgi:hypothetical protein